MMAATDQKLYRPEMDWTGDAQLVERFKKWKREVKNELLLRKTEFPEQNAAYCCAFVIICSGERGEEVIKENGLYEERTDSEKIFNCLESAVTSSTHIVEDYVSFLQIKQGDMSEQDYKAQSERLIDRILPAKEKLSHEEVKNVLMCCGLLSGLQDRAVVEKCLKLKKEDCTAEKINQIAMNTSNEKSSEALTRNPDYLKELLSNIQSDSEESDSELKVETEPLPLNPQTGCFEDGKKLSLGFKCPYEECNRKRRFWSQDTLDKHMKLHTEVKPFQCHVCHCYFKSLGKLNNHFNSHFKQQAYSCSYCDKAFSRKSFIKRHMASRHKEEYVKLYGELPAEHGFKCEICNKEFNSRNYFYQHKEIHSSESKYECQVCQKKFKQHAVLMAHMSVHSEDRPYKCGYCNRAFKSRAGLVNHENCFHKGLKPHRCDLCNKSFSKPYSLREHKKREHTLLL